MEGASIKTFLAYLEKIDKSLLRILTNFRMEERNGKVYLLTEDETLKEKAEKLLLTKLGNGIKNSVVVVLEEERQVKENKESKTAEGLSSRFSFQNFIVGEGNRLAYEVALEVAKEPGKIYNPLFIYGSVGLGKTHLLQAIGNECARRGYSVVYKSATDFSEEMVDSIKSGKIKEFRNRYRNIDLLLLDDVQFLSGKERTQIEFFNIFNHMFLNEKQIVLASDRHPKELKDVSDRLVSRFEGGLVVEVCMDEITKLEIIKRKLQELRIEVQDKIVQLLMESTSNNVRDIEGTIRSIKLKGTGHLKEKSLSKNDLEKIKLYTALHFGLKPEDLVGNKRSKKVNKARHIAFYLCKKLTDASLIEIARAFNRKDHSTVIYGIKKIEEEAKRDRKLSYILSFLEKHIGDRL
ncbi:MAG: chromosomal replication initiator protein DnaA [Aquificae bacterium]|nr:chromosomal replication initiator protein DnaA [Aquificota bacterium]